MPTSTSASAITTAAHGITCMNQHRPSDRISPASTNTPANPPVSEGPARNPCALRVSALRSRVSADPRYGDKELDSIAKPRGLTVASGLAPKANVGAALIVRPPCARQMQLPGHGAGGPGREQACSKRWRREPCLLATLTST